MNPTLITRIETHLDRRQYDPITDSIELLTEALVELKRQKIIADLTPELEALLDKMAEQRAKAACEKAWADGLIPVKTTLDCIGGEGGKVSLPQVKP